MENKKDMEFIQKVWEDVLDYEKSWLKSHSNSLVPVTKMLDYFGVENICKLYGCSVATETIAKELIFEAFK